MNTNSTKDAIKYIAQLEGMPYIAYHDIMPPVTDGSPFWNSNDIPPSINHVYKNGSVCVGLTNLVRRFMNLDIPGNISNIKTHDFIGGTAAWFSYLRNNNRLQIIDFNKKYPIGTLLIQDYNTIDGGHVAITIDQNKEGLLYSTIIHNINGIWNNKSYNKCTIESLKDYPYYNRHTHICLPYNWLLKN